MQTLNENTEQAGSSAYWGGRGDWLIVLAVHRDSGCLARSNFEVAKQRLEKVAENDPDHCHDSDGDVGVAVERFNHWAVGWVDYLLVCPSCGPLAEEAKHIEEKLEDYPVLDEEHFSQTEQTDADETWKNCYNPKERIKYIRKNRNQFSFRGLADLLGCVRGNYFCGYASELIG